MVKVVRVRVRLRLGLQNLRTIDTQPANLGCAMRLDGLGHSRQQVAGTEQRTAQLVREVVLVAVTTAVDERLASARARVVVPADDGRTAPASHHRQRTHPYTTPSTKDIFVHRLTAVFSILRHSGPAEDCHQSVCYLFIQFINPHQE